MFDNVAVSGEILEQDESKKANSGVNCILPPRIFKTQV